MIIDALLANLGYAMHQPIGRGKQKRKSH